MVDTTCATLRPADENTGFAPLADLFAPDLIVEVTTVCDRNCPGCYSPTLRTKNDIDETFRERPELFLHAPMLASVLEGMPAIPGGIALRGGEPSRHPGLESLVVTSRRYTDRVWVETHARWLIDPKPRGLRWLEVFRETGTIVKISFDRMHALRREHLSRICDAIDAHEVDWIIAITEPTPAEFATARQGCAWVPDEKVVFQEKVTDHRLLVQPRLGTLDITGNMQKQPTYKEAFRVIAGGRYGISG